MCGYANFSTVGIEIATLTVFAPKRSKFLVKTAAYAMLAGNISAFMNACIAGSDLEIIDCNMNEIDNY